MLTVSYTPYGTYHYSGNAAERDYHNLFYHPRIDFIDIHHYDNAQEMFGGSRYDNPGHIGRYWMTNEFVNCNTCPASNGQTYDGLGVDKPFHMGECSTWGTSVDLNPDPDPAETLWTSTSKLYDNYEVSFHNELWATAMMGNFTTGLTWQWHVVHWWPDALHAPRSENFSPDDPTNILSTNPNNGFNWVFPAGAGAMFKIYNKKIFHNYKPLSDFYELINLYYPFVWDTQLIPHRYLSQGVEAYYLTVPGREFGFGWVHNYNKYWGNSYYGYQGVENYYACSYPSSQSFQLSDLNAFAEYDVVFKPTRLPDINGDPQELPSTYSNFSAGNNLIVPLAIATLGCDSSNNLTNTSADFAFIFWGSSFRQANQSSQILSDQSNDASLELSVRPNPASDYFTLYVNGLDSTKSFAALNVYNSVGDIVLKDVTLNKNYYNLNTEVFPKGIYFIRVTSDQKYGVQKVIVQ